MLRHFLVLRWHDGAACGVCTGKGFNEGSVFLRGNEICLSKAGVGQTETGNKLQILLS